MCCVSMFGNHERNTSAHIPATTNTRNVRSKKLTEPQRKYVASMSQKDEKIVICQRTASRRRCGSRRAAPATVMCSTSNKNSTYRKIYLSFLACRGELVFDWWTHWGSIAVTSEYKIVVDSKRFLPAADCGWLEWNGKQRPQIDSGMKIMRVWDTEQGLNTYTHPNTIHVRILPYPYHVFRSGENRRHGADRRKKSTIDLIAHNVT